MHSQVLVFYQTMLLIMEVKNTSKTEIVVQPGRTEVFFLALFYVNITIGYSAYKSSISICSSLFASVMRLFIHF